MPKKSNSKPRKEEYRAKKGTPNKSEIDKSMAYEIEICSVDNPPKRCYDYWTADKKYDKNTKKKNESEELIFDFINEFIILEKKSKKNNLSKITKDKLKTKAKKYNMPANVLYTVYRKGLRAWLTGHRPGTNQHAWAMARVNSFCTGGKTRKVDKKEYEKVIKWRKNKK